MISGQPCSFVLHKVIAHLFSEALETSPSVQKLLLTLRKNVLFNSSIEILHQTQSPHGQLSTLEVWTDNLQQLANAYDEKPVTGWLSSELNCLSLYLNKEKGEECGKILVFLPAVFKSAVKGFR